MHSVQNSWLFQRTVSTLLHYPFKDEAQTALFKDPVHTAL